MGMTRGQAEKYLNSPVHTMQITDNQYRVIYEYEAERDETDVIKFDILDFCTFGMGTLIVSPIDRFQGSRHLMAVDYLRESRYALDDKVIGINYRLKNNPNAMVWSDKGLISSKDADWNEVIRTSSIAITLDPGLVSPYINRAWAYAETGEYDKAIIDCNTALRIEPESALAFNNRGVAFEGKGKISDAVENYEKACKLGFALACENLGRFEED
jgi:tetratricopeptide (TPR) repeat protein